jgi:arsenate reductase (thioredoxin)
MATGQTLNILFLCTGNSARSILGEALTDHLGGSAVGPSHRTQGTLFCGFSAGSMPVGTVNPVALEVLEGRGLKTEGYASKSWDVFSGDEAANMDIILTVCDNAAAETCPVWPGHPASAHWGLPDPAAVEGPHKVKVAAFQAVMDTLELRLTKVISEVRKLEMTGALERDEIINIIKGLESYG